jgi:hypothetical protein
MCSLLPEAWAGQNHFGRDRKVTYPVSQCATKHAKWLHEQMTKGAASVNAACGMEREMEDEGSINVIQLLRYG